MVYALPQSFKAEFVEYEEFREEEENGLTVAQLQLEDVQQADAVIFEKSSAMQMRFIRPLFIKALIEGRPVGRVMVDGGAMVNVMPTSFFKKLGKDENELKPTDSIMTDFTGNGQQARGVLTTELTLAVSKMHPTATDATEPERRVPSESREVRGLKEQLVILVGVVERQANVTLLQAEALRRQDEGIRRLENLKSFSALPADQISSCLAIRLISQSNSELFLFIRLILPKRVYCGGFRTRLIRSLIGQIA
uniref:Uncharacterized protein n=1 Tax=Ananas comosus var. bracteatus TaxID=296719 RepID=A0A6V7NTI4_ANACO|nr:unnamed protein product [Ananas comosus var. bracteatus]